MAQRRLVARLGMRGGVWQNKSELRMPIPHFLEVKAIFGSKDLFWGVASRTELDRGAKLLG